MLGRHCSGEQHHWGSRREVQQAQQSLVQTTWCPVKPLSLLLAQLVLPAKPHLQLVTKLASLPPCVLLAAATAAAPTVQEAQRPVLEISC